MWTDLANYPKFNNIYLPQALTDSQKCTLSILIEPIG